MVATNHRPGLLVLGLTRRQGRGPAPAPPFASRIPLAACRLALLAFATVATRTAWRHPRQSGSTASSSMSRTPTQSGCAMPGRAGRSGLRAGVLAAAEEPHHGAVRDDAAGDRGRPHGKTRRRAAGHVTHRRGGWVRGPVRTRPDDPWHEQRGGRFRFARSRASRRSASTSGAGSFRPA